MKEVVISGMKGWKSKMKRRVLTGRMYRSAKSTLPTRCRKKLTEKTSWYRKRKRMEDEEEDPEGCSTEESRSGGKRKIEEESKPEAKKQQEQKSL